MKIRRNKKAVKFILQKGDLANCNFDADLIKQSLMNILQNAFDAVNKDGEVILQYQKIKNDLVIQVSDNGIGISSDTTKKDF